MTNSIEAKVVFLGASCVGKTCIVTRATSDFFDSDEVPTVGASFSTKTINCDNTRVTLRIWDTAGQERFRSLAPMYYQGSQAAIVVFSLTDRQTLQEAKEWVDELKKYFEQLPTIYLIGNKADLEDQRQISDDDAQKVADELNARYFETSAQSGQNITELFEDVSYEMIRQQNEIKSETRPVALEAKSNQAPQKKECC